MAAEKTILVAEDTDQDLQMLMRAFESAGVQNPVRVVRDGLEAIHYLSGKGIYSDRKQYPFPSILLLDLSMPKKDGFDVLQFIGEHLMNSKLLTIVLTGISDRRLIDKAYTLGANSFLSKPTRVEDMQNLVTFFKDYWLILNKAPEPPTGADRQRFSSE